MKILMFSTHSMKYIWYSPQKSKYPLYIRHFELSTGDVIMNIAVSFSLRFAENMLNMSLGSFQIAPFSIYRVYNHT